MIYQGLDALLSVYFGYSDTFVRHLFKAHFYQHGVRTYALHASVRNYIFVITAEQPKKPPRSRHYKRFDVTVAHIKFYIAHASQYLTVTGIYNIFVSKFTYSHSCTQKNYKFYFKYIYAGKIYAFLVELFDIAPRAV